MIALLLCCLCFALPILAAAKLAGLADARNPFKEQNNNKTKGQQ